MLRKVVAFLTALLVATHSFAASVRPSTRLLTNRSSQLAWVAPFSPTFDCDFVAWKCFFNGGFYAPEQLFSDARASALTTNWAPWGDGHWSTFPSNIIRRTDLGLFVEVGATNLALRSRDMTNASWVKTNMTTAQTATGIDNATNAATQVTSSAANGTSLQAVTQASSSETYSVFLERVTGSGEVDITVDGGTTWVAADNTRCRNTRQALVSLSTTVYVRCAVTQTVTNPSVGIRIVVNGDSVNVDQSQLEATAFATHPITTTTVSVARSVDNITANAPLGKAITNAAWPESYYAAGTIYDASAVRAIFVVHDGTVNNYCDLRISAVAKTNIFSNIATVTTGNVVSTSTISTPGAFTGAGACNSADYAVVLNGASLATATTAGTLPAVSAASIGVLANGTSTPYEGSLTRLTMWNQRLPNSVIQGLTK